MATRAMSSATWSDSMSDDRMWSHSSSTSESHRGGRLEAQTVEADLDGLLTTLDEPVGVEQQRRPRRRAPGWSP